MNFVSKANRDLAQGMHESWLMGRKLNVMALTERFSCECRANMKHVQHPDLESVQGDQIVALGEINRNRMAMSSALRARDTEVEQALSFSDEDGTRRMHGNEFGTGGADTDHSNNNNTQDATNERHK
jgi:hypothetical protein